MRTTDAGLDLEVIEWQLGRSPRQPFRVAARCSRGHPMVIVSPSVLDDGERFPTFAWLTCPHLQQSASHAESSGALAEWDARAAADPALSAALFAADEELRVRRAAESGGRDDCGTAGIAGRQRGGVKCLHARIAAVLIGISEPVGTAILSVVAAECEDDRCGRRGGADE